MPYIDRKRRVLIETGIRILLSNVATDGELNYAMTRLASAYATRMGINYDNLNRVHGTFHSAGAEFYRRVVAPYEDKRLEENGDVY